MDDQGESPFLFISEKVLGYIEPGFGMLGWTRKNGRLIFLLEPGSPSAQVMKTLPFLPGVLSM